MTHWRHSGRQRLGGVSVLPSAYDADTHVDSIQLAGEASVASSGSIADRRSLGTRRKKDQAPIPLPSGSIQEAPPISEADREFAAGAFVTTVLSLAFLIPMLAAGVMMHFK